jgi:hypothetical protein
MILLTHHDIKMVPEDLELILKCLFFQGVLLPIEFGCELELFNFLLFLP